MDISESQNLGSSPSLYRDIYARRVPGISDGGILRAMEDDPPTNAAAMNDVFTRTSPAVFQQQQAMFEEQRQQRRLQQQIEQQQQQQQQQVQSPNESLLRDIDATVNANVDRQASATRRQLTDLLTSIDQFTERSAAVQRATLEQVTAMRCAQDLHFWILLALGVLLLALIAVLLYVVLRPKPTKVAAVLPTTVATSPRDIERARNEAARRAAARAAQSDEETSLAASGDFV